MKEDDERIELDEIEYNPISAVPETTVRRVKKKPSHLEEICKENRIKEISDGKTKIMCSGIRYGIVYLLADKLPSCIGCNNYVHIGTSRSHGHYCILKEDYHENRK